MVRAEEVENAGDYPVLEDGKHKGVIGVGGLALARYQKRSRKQRQEYMKDVMLNENEASKQRSHEGAG